MISLRPYQHRCIQEVLAAFRAGYRAVCLVSPTGSGKRRLAMWLMEYAAQNNRRVLFLGNRRLLINQAANEAEEHGIEFGTIMANLLQGDAGSSNQIASIHTLESWYLRGQKWTQEGQGEGLPPADLIITDECHQNLDKYARLLHFYPEAKHLGLTATPVGPAGRAIAPSPFEVLIEPVKNSELIQGGWLLSTTVYAPSEPCIDGVKIVSGEYVQTQLGRAVQTCTVFGDVFKEWEEKGCRNMATVCFVPGVAFGRDLERQFNYYLGGHKAHVIEAKTKPADRERILGGLGSGATKVVISVDVLREGFDAPVLECAIDLQPNHQLRSYWQKIGRIKRPFGHQRQATYLDFAGNYHRFPHPDADPTWPEGPEETTQEVIQKQREAGTQAQPIMCPKCSFVRQRGETCPKCGHTNPKAIRRVRMGDGKLKEMPAHTPAKRQPTKEERMFSRWTQRLYAALYTGATYSQAARLYHKKTGEYPQEGWVGVYPVGDLRWKTHVQDDHSFKSLTRACNQYKERMNGQDRERDAGTKLPRKQ